MLSDRRENSSLVLESLSSAMWALTRRRWVRIALILIVLFVVWVA